MSDFWTEADLIHVYSRAQALDDGFLVDVSAVAAEAGFKWPTAVTRAVWDEYVEVPEGDRYGQSIQGRLWDICWMAKVEARRHGSASRFSYQLHVRQNNHAGDPPLVTLELVCGPGDTPEPVLTIMKPGED